MIGPMWQNEAEMDEWLRRWFDQAPNGALPEIVQRAKFAFICTLVFCGEHAALEWLRHESLAINRRFCL